MNINHLKPDWERFKVQHALDTLTPTEILQIIEQAPDHRGWHWKRWAYHTLIFLFLMIVL